MLFLLVSIQSDCLVRLVLGTELFVERNVKSQVYELRMFGYIRGKVSCWRAAWKAEQYLCG